MKPYKIIILFLIGILIGWFLPDWHSHKQDIPITIHDTLKLPSVTYKYLPGTNYNIDSLITVINQSWKDSLKNLYGHGLFESKFTKTDDLGTRNYTYTSRIPPDPESQLIIDESLSYPKRTFGIISGIGSSALLGLKYYLHDSKRYSISGNIGSEYLFAIKNWNYFGRLELEMNF